MIRDFARLAYLSLKNRRLRSWLTMIGIFIGIAAVVALIGLGEGLRAGVMAQFNFLSTDILTVQAQGLAQGPPGTGVVNPLQEHYIDDIERINGIDMAIGRIIESAKLQFNSRSDFTFVGSMPSRDKRKEVERIAQLEIASGRMLKDGDSRRIVVGSNYASSSEFGIPVSPGDKIIVQGREFEVVGLLKKKGSFITDNIVLMNEKEVKEVFNVNNTYNVIAVKVISGQNLTAVKERLDIYLRKERDVEKGEEDFTVESPEQALRDLDATLFAIQAFVYVIAGISIIVGGIGIANTMYTSVVERIKQIGIMKSVGARNRDVFILFFIEAGFLGMVGGSVGVLVGMGLAYGLAAAASSFVGGLLIVDIGWPLVIGSLLFSFVIGSVAGVLPAYQASKLKPVDALRSVK